MSATLDRRSLLVRALRDVGPSHRTRLEDLKREGSNLRDRPDALWILLLQSFATMGNSRGWRGLFETPGLVQEVAYERLSPLPSRERIAIIARVFRAAKVRRPDTKAAWLSENVALVRSLGGPVAAWQHALSLHDRKAKLEFLLRFKGIGDKYARNIWMDVYDESFRGSIAIDERIKAFSRVLGNEFKSYADHEAYYQQLAADAQLEAWELDRLLYQFKDEFMSAISEAG